ncbi:MAG TPA: LLM class flavin-dependent oxidoreductase [Candidatus Limnocylindrales bacterium]|nr:LLM class flavin-dependent oxidoreductase [Candidatus Limnocylindrales bacterium]
MKVGIMLPIGDTDGPSGSPTFQDVMAAARAAEDGGLDSVWLADHFLYRAQDGREFGLHEAWTLLSGIAAVTNRVQLGTLVLCTSFRNPVLTAKMAATLDVVSNGRLVLGLGCGWHEPEYSAMGLPFAERVSEFAESIEIISRLLRGERLSHAGRHHRLTDAVLAPPPIRHIPILVAAKKPRMLRLAAQWADAWNTAWYGRPNAVLDGRLADFGAAMAEVGRPLAEVERTVGIDVRDSAQAAIPEPSPNALGGDVDDLVGVLDAYSAMGIDHVIVGLEPMTVRSVERLVQAVGLMTPSGRVSRG